MIKILFLAANPSDTTRLRLDEESRAIDQAIRQAEFRDRFEIMQHWAIRVTDLQSLLLRHKPDIVHFSGHGSAEDEIILEDVSSKSRSVSIRALSQLFSILKDNIRCVVLNACYSEPQAQAIAEYIDCVVGMSTAIGDKAAISFAASFYQALGYGRGVKAAFELGCVQLDLEKLGEQNTPKLLSLRSDPEKIVFVQTMFRSAQRLSSSEPAEFGTEEVSEERAFLTQALLQHKRNLYRLQEKKSKYGIDIPVSVLNQIDDEEKEIRRLEALLKLPEQGNM